MGVSARRLVAAASALLVFACDDGASAGDGARDIGVDAATAVGPDAADAGGAADARDAASPPDADAPDAAAPDAAAPDASADDAGPSWRACPPLPGGPRQETAVVAVDGEVWVLGGFDRARRVVDRVEVFDVARGAWRAGPTLPVPLHHAQAAVVDGAIFVLGFLTGADFRPDPRGLVLERGASAWRSVAALPNGTARGGGIAVTHRGQIWVLGGLRLGAVDDVTIYDPARDAHVAGPRLPAPRDHLGAGVVGGRLVVVGGRRGRIESHAPTTWSLDDAAQAWVDAAPLPTSRGGFASAVLGDALVVVGGEGNANDARGVFDVVEAYDGVAGAWRSAPPLPRGIHGPGAAAVGPWLLVPGGADAQAFAAVETCAMFGP